MLGSGPLGFIQGYVYWRRSFVNKVRDEFHNIPTVFLSRCTRKFKMKLLNRSHTNMWAFRKVHVCTLFSYIIVYSLGILTIQWNNSRQTPVHTYDSRESVIMRRALTHDVADSTPRSERVRVLCWIMTCKKYLQTKAIHVQNTWGKRCDTILFISDEDDPKFPALGLNNTKGYNHLTAKTMNAFQYIYENHLEDADWFMKADDNTYVILENLRYFLSAHAPTEATYFGRPFNTNGRYHSGGAGYILSRESLRRFGTRKAGTCSDDGGYEDMQIGMCLRRLKVTLGESRDTFGRSRFNAFSPWQINSGKYPKGYERIDGYGAPVGINSSSPYAISFHYINAVEMYLMDYYVYQLRPHGVRLEDEDLNTDKTFKFWEHKKLANKTETANNISTTTTKSPPAL